MSRRIYKVARTNELWRNLCFDTSRPEPWKRRNGVPFRPSLPFQAHPTVQDFRRRTNAALSAHAAWVTSSTGTLPSNDVRETSTAQSIGSEYNTERSRALANWDPTYSDEKVDWYAEYVARNGPLSKSWLQPACKHANGFNDKIEVKGLGLHRAEHVIAPLEDGSVCVWNIKNIAFDKPRGTICARSRPGTLGVKELSMKSLASGINGTVSVDNDRHKAYIATENYLQEIDMHTLSVSSQQRFPWAIATLSDIVSNVPLTVGTRCGLHLYDPRQKVRSDSFGLDHLDSPATSPRPTYELGATPRLSSGKATKSYASLFQPGPTSIIHLFPHGSTPSASVGDIVVAGRFPSLLMYDRRTFPKMRSTFHSGAQLCSLASLPYSFRSLETGLMNENQLSVRAAQEAKSQAGDTLFACGEYQGKGSLEIYGLSPERNSPANSEATSSPMQTSTFKNRVSASRSKLLSIAVHGTRLVVSDGDGQIRWLDRNGQTLIRETRLCAEKCLEQYFSGNHSSPGSDVALKVLPVHSNMADVEDITKDEVLVWTGEKIGLIGFSNHPRFGGEDGQAWEERIESAEAAMQRREEKIYGETMRRALQRQADEVRWVTGLGLMG